MPEPNDNDFEEIVERLDRAVSDADTTGALRIAQRAAALVSEPDKMLEIAEMLFEAGLLEHARRWLQRIEAGRWQGKSLRGVTLRHFLWLKVNLAWQRGDFDAAVRELEQCESELEPPDPSRALRFVASALAMLADHSEVDPYAAQAARDALRIESCPIEGRLAAAVVLALEDPVATELRALATDPELHDPEGSAYRDAAIDVLRRLGHDTSDVSWSTRHAHAAHRRAYDAACRYARPVVARVCLPADRSDAPMYVQPFGAAARSAGPTADGSDFSSPTACSPLRARRPMDHEPLSAA